MVEFDRVARHVYTTDIGNFERTRVFFATVLRVSRKLPTETGDILSNQIYILYGAPAVSLSEDIPLNAGGFPSHVHRIATQCRRMIIISNICNICITHDSESMIIRSYTYATAIFILNFATTRQIKG